MCQSKHVNTEIKKLQKVSLRAIKKEEKRVGWGEGRKQRQTLKTTEKPHSLKS